MDVVLIQPPLYKRRPNKRSQPQLGLGSIASYLAAEGLDVHVIDGQIKDRTMAQIMRETEDLKPWAVGLTTTTEDRFNAIELIQTLKARLGNALLFSGGPHFSYSAVDALENISSLDLVVVGEGELTTLEALHRFREHQDPHGFAGIDGCAFRDRSKAVISNPPRGLVEDLDGLPDIDWGLFEMDQYQGTLSVEEKTRAVGVISTRGCPYRCVFCSNSLNRRLRHRSVGRFVDEIERLQRDYGFPGLNFQDDSFTAHTEHVRAICEEILRRELSIRWYCSLRINNISYETLSLMKRAGCVALGYGIESGSDRILKIIRKGITTEQIRSAIKITKRLEFEHVSLFLMNSLPGLTKEDMLKSSLFINEIESILRGTVVNKLSLGVSTLVYPGTELEVIAKENGNVLPPGFSWNTYYETDRGDIFNSNRHVPHFENREFDLGAIKRYSVVLRRKLIVRRFFELVGQLRSPVDLIRLIRRVLVTLPAYLKRN
ncbi:MAG: radical SAM protein [Candidatus Alcyoniella australis]|nr:radical SAM protein [Candidatus Alcyoniella australis]